MMSQSQMLLDLESLLKTFIERKYSENRRIDEVESLKTQYGNNYDVHDSTSTLLIAAIKFDLKIAQYLIEKNAKVNFCGFSPMSPLAVLDEKIASLSNESERSSYKEFRDLLISKGAKSFKTQIPNLVSVSDDDYFTLIKPYIGKQYLDGSFDVSMLADFSSNILDNMSEKAPIEQFATLNKARLRYVELMRSEMRNGNYTVSPDVAKRMSQKFNHEQKDSVKTKKPAATNSWCCFMPFNSCMGRNKKGYVKLEEVELSDIETTKALKT